MPQEIKTKWIEALRSGEYKQGKKSLKNENGAYCCLGVLQMCVQGEVTMESEGVPADMPSRSFYKTLDPEFDTKTSVPGLAFELAERNDEGYTFEYLADIIESEVIGL